MSANGGEADSLYALRFGPLFTHAGRRDGYGMGHCQDGLLLDQSGLAPENLTTLPHLSVSSAMNFPKSAGEPASTVPPISATRALIFGSASAALISLLSLLMMSTGVALGAPTPCTALAS